MIFYTVYRTQNIVNGKYYFGVHKTRNPYDEYLGSGKILKYAIKKYGEQAFIKNVCFVFDNPTDAFEKEHELIETYRADPLCYNLRQGGSGGFDYINRKSDQTWRKDLGKNTFTKLHTTGKFDEVWKQARKKGQAHPNSVVNNKDMALRGSLKGVSVWKGQHHTPENCQLFRELRTGIGNPWFGMKWMYNEHKQISQRVLPDRIEEFITLGWVLGRKIRFTLLETKMCSGECGSVLPVAEFKFNRCRNGFQGKCKKCERLYKKLRAQGIAL